jgi:hypothetical protein
MSLISAGSILLDSTFKAQGIFCIREYQKLLINKILLAIHHKISTSLYMPDHISLVLCLDQFYFSFFFCAEKLFLLFI